MKQENSYDPECFDLHVHSIHSSDGTRTTKDILIRAKELGLGGVAIVDHNSRQGGLDALECDVEGVIAIPGMEVTSADGGHILALGVSEDVPRGLSPVETVEKIREVGGIAIAPHPYRFWSGLGEEATKDSDFDILEVINARSVRSHNNKARNLAKELGTGMTGGSDAHDLEHIGFGRTRFPHVPADIDEALQLLSQKKTTGEGMNRPASDTIRYVLKSVSQWMGRGMRRM